MSEQKIIAVVGATGAQGGSLVQSILNDKSGEFRARAITRDVNSDKAKAEYKNGALRVEMPKKHKEEPKGRRLEIQ